MYLSECVVYTPTPHIYKYLGPVRVRGKKKYIGPSSGNRELSSSQVLETSLLKQLLSRVNGVCVMVTIINFNCSSRPDLSLCQVFRSGVGE